MFGGRKSSGQRSKYLEKMRGVLKDKEDKQKEQAKHEDTHEKEEGKTERDQYASIMKAKLDEWDAEVKELERNYQRFRSSIVEEHADIIEKLDQRIGKGREKMKEVIESTDEAWHHIKEDADTILTEIRTNLDSARKTYHDELEDE